MLDRRTGADGKSYGIGFALALPGDWNGRFLFQGGGGLNGNVGAPLGAAGAGGTPALARGFAVVRPTPGIRGTGFDASFMAEQQASLDFAYQAVGRVAELAKQIIARHYAKAPDRSYFAGCSTGGREGMLMTQRYPRYFDGVDLGRSGDAYELLGHRRRVGGDDAQHGGAEGRAGVPHVRQALSDADKKLVIDGAAERLRRQRRRQGRDDLRPAVVPVRSQGARVQGRQDRQLPHDGAGGRASRRVSPGPRTRRAGRSIPGFFYDTGHRVHAGHCRGCCTGGRTPWVRRSRRRRWTWTRARSRRGERSRRGAHGHVDAGPT